VVTGQQDMVVPATTYHMFSSHIHPKDHLRKWMQIPLCGDDSSGKSLIIDAFAVTAAGQILLLYLFALQLRKSNTSNM